MVKVDLSGAKSFFIGNGPDYSAAAAAHKVLAERLVPVQTFWAGRCSLQKSGKQNLIG